MSKYIKLLVKLHFKEKLKLDEGKFDCTVNVLHSKLVLKFVKLHGASGMGGLL